jgi:hypothetical protein
MPLPLPQTFSLEEGAHYVANRCKASIADAKDAMERAFREYSLGIFDNRSLQRLQGFGGAEIDWGNSSVVGGENLTINGTSYTAKCHLYRGHIDGWIDDQGKSSERAASTGNTANSSAEPNDSTTHRTGAPGRPTSWDNLIVPECRRRYRSGERYPNDRTKFESPANWARVLIAWLVDAHKGAAIPKPKTLTNKLGALLSELAKEIEPSR